MTSRLFTTHLRVRYHETDQMGIVHHSQYVRYLEVARVELLREMGISYRDLEEAGWLLVVAGLGLRYHAPLRFDDTLTVHTQVTRLSGVRVELAYRLVRGEGQELIATGQTTLACVDRQGRLQAIPADFRARMKEALQPKEGL